MKAILLLMLLFLTSCSAFDLNINGTTTKLTINKTIIQKDTKDSTANLSGSKLEDVAKDLEFKGGSIEQPKPPGIEQLINCLPIEIKRRQDYLPVILILEPIRHRFYYCDDRYISKCNTQTETSDEDQRIRKLLEIGVFARG